MQEAFTEPIMEVCGSRWSLGETFSVAPKLLKKTKKLAYSSCRLCTVFVQACVYMHTQ